MDNDEIERKIKETEKLLGELKSELLKNKESRIKPGDIVISQEISGRKIIHFVHVGLQPNDTMAVLQEQEPYKRVLVNRDHYNHTMNKNIIPNCFKNSKILTEEQRKKVFTFITDLVKDS